MDLMTIGEMAKLNNISSQALRLYDRIGLLNPYFVDKTTGYRYYNIKQCARLDMINYMKELGMPKTDKRTAVVRTIENCNRYSAAPKEGIIVIEHLPERKIYCYKCGVNIYEHGLDTYEFWTIHGEPNTTLKIEEPRTVELTCATTVNRIPQLKQSKCYNGIENYNNSVNTEERRSIFVQKLFLNRLFEHVEGGSFRVKYWDDTISNYGEGEPEFTLILKKPLSKREMLNDPYLYLGEAHMEGDIDFEGDIRTILELGFKNKDLVEKDSKLFGTIAELIPKAPDRNKEDIKHHYDIGNDFYSLWLDESMTYSCAYFEQPEDTLYEAQRNKVDYILKKLSLKKGHTLLDIGSGWGELIIQAAKQYGAKSLGITLSEEQFTKTKERIKEENLEDLVDVKVQDYRELASSGNKFDRLVSVGMLEHVGRANIPDFMDCADSLLKDGGVFLLHTITKQIETMTNTWLEKYIFPGGYVPSVREIVHILPEHDFYIKDMESLRLHYAKTLEHWADNFEENIDKIRDMFDEPFIRMWRVYLNSCIFGFRYRIVDVHEFLLEKGINNKLPMTRYHLYR